MSVGGYMTPEELAEEFWNMSYVKEWVGRMEDMSPRGRLEVMQQMDGDVIVIITPDDGNGMLEASRSVEFCTSGGKSPKTREALYALIEAMKQDNIDCPYRDPGMKP